jgi:hypothetical protein
MANIGGPIFQLQWFGLLCPCLEKEDSRTARQAVAAVNTATKRILWNTENKQENTRFSLGALFGKSKSNSSVGDDKNAVAVLRIRDSAEGYPEIFVDPMAGAQKVGYKLNIKLRRIHTVQVAGADSDEIVLTAKIPTGQNKNAKPKELLRFCVLQDSVEDEKLAVPSDQRNLVVHHLAVLVEWERQRRAADPDGDWDDDEDDEDQPNFLAARAQKAAHFAQREIELQQTKREREKRKAKLVEQSGGLKYTALAMANRID